MLKSLYEAIRNDAEPAIFEIDNRQYSDKRLFPIEQPKPVAITVSTLTGLTQYLASNVDNLDIKSLLCHVVSPTYVAISSKLLQPFLDRNFYIEAKLVQIDLPFNKWMDAEAFIIAMQACFTDRPTPTSKMEILKYLSSISSIVESGATDDGVSQAVSIKSGIASKALSVLPNPVTLRPYRTFTEVEQPASQFVFRIRQDKGFQYSLTEADGGAWRNQAMSYIQEFMENAVPGLNVIA